MTDATPQAALLSDAAKLADELDHEASKRACNVAMMPASLPVDAAKELRRLDALVAHLTADRDDTANELALRTKHNIALTNERDQLLAKLQATQEPLQAIPEAMKVVTEALRSDPDYAWSWHCNVAMASVDEGMGHYEANQAAARFMRLLAGVDTTKHQGFPEAPEQEPVQAGELPAFEQWWRQRQLLTFPKDYDQSRLADWGAAYKPAAKDAWQARAALSARKPLVHGDLNPDRIFGLADVHAEESQEDGRRIFDRDGLVGFAMDAARIGSYQAMDPLTKEQIKDLAQDEELLLICDGFDSLEDIVSVIERAHGIGLEVKP